MAQKKGKRDDEIYNAAKKVSIEIGQSKRKIPTSFHQ